MSMYLFQEIFMLNSSHAGESRSRILGRNYSPVHSNYPITLKISTQHYSSTVKIEVSYIQDGPDPYDDSYSITIHEKLVLKQQ